MVLTKAGLALVALFLFAAPANSRGWDDDFSPRQPSVSQPGHREWTWDGDDNLRIEAPVTVRYSPDGPARVVITGPDELLAHIQVGQGRIRCDDDWHYSGHGQVKVSVSGVTVHNVTLAGTGEMVMERLNLDHLRLAVLGSGQLTGNGRADQVDLTIAGSGDADLGHLAARRADIRISGSGNVALTPREEANITVTGSGNVRMAARPARLNQVVTGSGGARFDN